MKKVGIIGLGYGRQVMMPAVLQSKILDLVGICGSGRNLETRRLESLGCGDLLCDNPEHLLQMKPDIVLIATPPNFTDKLSQFFLSHRIPVLCEKPISADLTSAYQIYEYSRKMKMPTAVDFQFYQIPQFQKLKQILQSDLKPKVKKVNVTWCAQSYVQKNQIWSWKSDLNRGGGVLNLLGSHILFLVYWLFGEIRSVRAEFNSSQTRKFSPSEQDAAEDTINIILELRAGFCVNVHVSNSRQDLHSHCWEVYFDNGKLSLENKTRDYMNGFELIGQNYNLTQSGDFETNGCHKVGVIENDGRIGPFSALLHQFSDNCFKGFSGGYVPSFASGFYVQLLMECARHSAKTNIPINVDSISDNYVFELNK